ncbi:non-ribosomal peptide synthetase [Flavobacterium chilense]|uniref:Non-ribosomal peptide synthase domain TIGR01720/amino acid adenylation domain-containing protein n=1 Tax=Flavobacterium chilense TaxID=946677 RepID=A0A1M6XDR6_9FLAO|nr:non-ribosomal peptide synthetase [Flavobacterium chilense]SHL04117.1 non-ribosomal peptide synthase domain TIGR01720/amino acid adenylation domain-containing protein [Flavobacterium chilense]
MIKSIKDLLSELRGQNINLILNEEDNIEIITNRGKIPAELIDEVKGQKNDIINYLKSIKNLSNTEISKIEISDSYVVSSAQRSLWIVSQIEESSIAYNIPSSITLNGISNVSFLQKAVESVIDRHEILRTVFKQDEDGVVKQIVSSRAELGFKIENIDFRQDENPDIKIKSLIEVDSKKSFNLEKGPLLRVFILQKSDESYVLYYNMHHIISDEWSKEVLEREVVSFYEAYKNGVALELPDLKIQYKDYSAWENSQLESENSIADKEYWNKQFSGELPVLNLPTNKTRPRIKTFNGRSVSTYIESDEISRLKKIAQSEGGSLFMGFLAVLKILLYKYTNENDIIVGTVIAGREELDLKDQIGFYVKTLALRNQLTEDDTFLSFLNKLKDNTLLAYKHQKYPFDKLVTDLNQKADISRSPIFDFMVGYHNITSVKNNPLNVTFNEIKDLGENIVKTDIEFHFLEIGDSICFNVIYNSDVYESEMIRELMFNFKQILSKVLDSPGKKITNIDYLSSLEKSRLLDEFNDTKVDLGEEKTVLELFKDQVLKTPDAAAVVFGSKRFTYQDLDTISSQLSKSLKNEYGIEKGDRVGIQLHRSEWPVIAILAVLKTGGVYVPIDSELPANRKAYIAEDTDLKLLITETSFILELDFYQGNVLSIDVEFEASADLVSIDNPDVTFDDLAYIIYTSGSTGQPKGVMVGYGSLSNYLLWAKNYYLHENLLNTNFGLFTSLSFDLTITSLFLPLISGGTLEINQGEQVVDLLQSYLASDISCIKLTPSHISVLGNLDISSANLEVAVVGGEELRREHIEILHRINPSIRIYNEYGPTETTVGCTVHEVSLSDDKILIGKPIWNTSIYILDEFKNLQTEGVVGEIYIGGSGLAHGYFNRADLTADKFILNPFKAGEKIYKTGDLGKWLPDGTIEYKGRIDDQVKIRGYRIELGEIERNISLVKGINQSVVTVTENESDKALVAYFVAENKIDKKIIQDELSKILPDYMVPGYYVQIKEMPLTSNGKINRNKLPEVSDADLIKEEYIAPRTKEEELLVNVWSEILKRDQLSVKDSFYNLGGDSIKSIQVISRIKQKGYTLKVEQILRNPILEDLAKLVESNTVFVDQSEVKGPVLLTPIQQYFFESNLIPNKNHYNQSVVLKCNIELDSDNLEQTIATLVRHHDALRMVYDPVTYNCEQYNEDSLENHYKIIFKDLRGAAVESEELEKEGDKLQSDFDITSGILFHVGHFKMSDGDRLVLVVHHLVIDGVSWRIIFEDLSNLYTSYQAKNTISLPQKTDSFQRWAIGLKGYAISEKMKKERDYWENLTKETITPFNTDFTLENVMLKADSSISLNLDAEITQKLQTNVHHVYKTEINDVLLTGLALALREVFGVEKSVLKMEGHGREEIIDGVDIGRTVGWFTSVYPFVLDVSNAENFEIVKVKESLRNVPDKGVGYGILNYLDKRFANELVSTIQFNYLGDFGENVGIEKEASLFDFSSEKIGRTSAVVNEQSDVLLDISGMMVSGKLGMSIRYSSDAFNQETIQKLANAYKNQLIILIEKLSEEKNKYLTPSDLTYNGLDYNELSVLNFNGNIEDIYTLSPLQQGLYYHWLVDHLNPMYFEQITYRLHFEDLDIEAVRQAYNQLVDRYAVLRTSFTNDYGIPLQIVHKSVSSNFSYITLNYLEDIENQLHVIKEEDKAEGFNFENPTQMRLKVIELGNNSYEFIWSSHHILMDGWCISILINDFYRMLMAIINNYKLTLPEPVKYSTYINWLSKINKEESLEYWKNYLKGIESVTEVPFKKVKEKQQVSNFKKEFLHVEGTTFEDIRELCSEIGITHNTFIQGAWGYLLSRYNNTSDVVFGSVVSGRPGELSGVENMVGLFINTIPVRIRYSENETPKEFLKRLHLEVLDSNAHHYLNLSEVQSQSNLGMELVKNLMIFENYLVQDAIEDEVQSLYGDQHQKITIEGVNVFEQTNYDFNIIISPSSSSLILDFNYDSEVFDSALIKNLVIHFSGVIQDFVAKDIQLLSQIDYLSKAEHNELLFDFNNTKIKYPQHKTVVDLFEDQVNNYSTKTAINDGITAYTYAELSTFSGQISAFLDATYGQNDKSPIAVLLDRSSDMVAVLLGILKSGRSYIPFDPTFPKERLNYIVENSQAQIIITEKEHVILCDDKVKVLKIESLLEEFSKYKGNSSSKANPAETAYIIYTSGSTGNPKGVEIGHKSLINFLTSIQQKPKITSEDTLFSVTTYSFDISILEFFAPLISGATLFVATQDLLSDPYLIIQKIEETNATIIQATPSFYQMLFNAEWNGNKKLKVLCGGDLLSEALAEKLLVSTSSVWNMYGPTETTIWSSCKKIEVPADASNIGIPINNTQFYILDKFNKLLPKGIPGNIYIGGAGLAKSYYKNEELTKSKFIANPFIEGHDIYDVGDLGYWLPDGSIKFLGRKDNQVKIRGFRIELGEIETILLQNNTDIKQAIVDVRQTGNEKILVAYFISENEINKKSLQKSLSKILPDYMLPGYYVQLDVIPLTDNGKVDRKRLPGVDGKDLIKEAYIAPKNKEEEMLITIWSEVLKQEKISIKDNFYNLGGDSIKSIQVVSRLKQKGYSIKMDTFIKQPVIEKLAKLIEAKEVAHIELSNENTNIFENKKWNYDDVIELSPNQKRFFKSKYSSVIINFEMSSFREDKFQDQFRIFLSNFPTLTVEYKKDNDKVFQYYVSSDNVKFKLFISDKIELSSSKSKENATEFLLGKFDLIGGELIKILILKKDKNNNNNVSVVMALHHSLADNYTSKIIKRELTNFFEGKQQETNYYHPFSFIAYQENFLNSLSAIEERNYWTTKLEKVKLSDKDEIQRNEKLDFVIQETIIYGENFNHIQKFSSHNNIPVSSLFNAFFEMLLSHLEIKDKELYRVLVDCREQEIKNFDVAKILGVIDNIIPLSYIDSEFNLDGIKKCYSNYLEARLHQRIPYEIIREDLLKTSKKDLDQSILGNFNFLIEQDHISLNDTTIQSKEYVDKICDFEGINLTCILHENAIEIKLVCLKEIYDAKTDHILLHNSIKKMMRLINE